MNTRRDPSNGERDSLHDALCHKSVSGEEGRRPSRCRTQGIDNLAFLGQFAELPDDVVFTVEYSVRSAQIAVYSLLKLIRAFSALQGQHDPRVLFAALKPCTANYRKDKPPALCFKAGGKSLKLEAVSYFTFTWARPTIRPQFVLGLRLPGQ